MYVQQPPSPRTIVFRLSLCSVVFCYANETRAGEIPYKTSCSCMFLPPTRAGSSLFSASFCPHSFSVPSRPWGEVQQLLAEPSPVPVFHRMLDDFYPMMKPPPTEFEALINGSMNQFDAQIRVLPSDADQSCTPGSWLLPCCPSSFASSENLGLMTNRLRSRRSPHVVPLGQPSSL